MVQNFSEFQYSTSSSFHFSIPNSRYLLLYFPCSPSSFNKSFKSILVITGLKDQAANSIDDPLLNFWMDHQKISDDESGSNTPVPFLSCSGFSNPLNSAFSSGPGLESSQPKVQKSILEISSKYFSRLGLDSTSPDISTP